MKPKKDAALKAENAALKRKLFEANAQLASALGMAFDTIPNAENFMGSGVILQLTALGGSEVIPPVMIRDGLSKETIVAIQDDLKRSYDLATMLSPSSIKVT